MIVIEAVVERHILHHQIQEPKGKAAALPMNGALAFLPDKETRND
jgi:hypothetical protein